MDTNITCPVCTLYLRKGITLADHLQTHPKENVIEALIALVSNKQQSNSSSAILNRRPENNFIPFQQNTFPIAPWQQQNQYPTNQTILVPMQTNNSSIIYQQFVNSVASQHPCVPVNQALPQYLTIPSYVPPPPPPPTVGAPQNPPVVQPCLYQPPQQQQQRQQPAQIVATPVSLGQTSTLCPITTSNGSIIPPKPIVTTATTEIIKSVNTSTISNSSNTQKSPTDTTNTNNTIIKEDDTSKIIKRQNNVTTTTSVSTIQLADITISTGSEQTSSTTNTNSNGIEYDQMEIIPIYKKSPRVDKIQLQNKIETTTTSTPSDNAVGDNHKSNENKTKRKCVIELFSNESSSNVRDHISSDSDCDKTPTSKIDENIETITSANLAYKNEKSELTTTLPDEHPTPEQNNVEQTATLDKQQDTDDFNNQQYILPDVTFYQIPKIEEIQTNSEDDNSSVVLNEEQSLNRTQSTKVSNENNNNSSKNDIVIIKNEVICTPMTTTDSQKEDKNENKIETIDTNSTNINQIETINYNNFSTEIVDAMNVVEFDGIKLMLNTDLINISVTPAEQNLHCNENIREKSPPPILLNIGEISSVHNNNMSHTQTQHVHDDVHDENCSRDSLNIRADERMPPKGELSEQESNGGNDEMWGKVFQEGSSGVSTSYDLLARESWEASDSSDSEVLNSLQSCVSSKSCYTNGHSSSVVRPTEEYKCCVCDEIFYCPKERRVHQSKVHGDMCETSNTGDHHAGQDVSKVEEEDVEEDEEMEEDEGYSKIKIEENEFCDNFKKVFEEGLGGEIEHETKPDPSETFMQSFDRYCDLCKIQFESTKTFISHYRDKHKDLPIPRYQCKVCKMCFSIEYKFTEHLKIHPLSCTICLKFFYRRQNLKIHLKRHLAFKPHKCEICKKAFVTKQKRLEHENIHKGLTPYKCNLCNDKFRRHSNLIQHRKSRHGAKKKSRDYVCHCGEMFKTKKRFLWHSEIHDSKPKSCTNCNEKFIHMASLTRHMRKAHNTFFVPDPNRENENVACPICKKIYLKASLDVHMKLHSGVKPFSCNICNKEFTTKWNLKLHRWVHAARTSKPFKCSLCQGAFVRHSDYTAHMNSHRNIKPYTCNYCGRQFIRKYNCQRHVKEHEHKKSHKCTICNKEFHRSYYLQEHLKVHSGARPFACHICGKTSSTKSNHNKHVRIHHAREPVSTEN